MADSDEECDRKKRDKFRRERSDYSTERRRSDHDRRPSYRDEYNDARKRGRDDDEDRDRRYHHGGSPPMGRRGGDWSPPISKRYRRDGWESLRDYGHGMMPGGFMMDRRPPPPWMLGGDMPHGGGMPPLPHGPRGMSGDMMMGFPGGDARQRGSALLSFKQFLSQQDDSIDDTVHVCTVCSQYS